MPRQLTLRINLSDTASFSNFFTAGNEEAVQALLQAAGQGQGPDLVYLFGPKGSGKTHLLYAAQREARLQGRDSVYLPLGALDDPAAAVESLNPSGLICLDDVHKIAGSEAAERAMMSLYEEVRLGVGRCTVLVSAVLPPASAGFCLADLSSRLASGTSYRLTALDDSGKRAALCLRAKTRGFDLPDDVLAYIMRRYARDNPTLFALLDQLDNASLAEKRRITLRFLQQLERENAND